jgi:hypothetical protein
MTNTKAFWICFFVPFVIFVIPFLLNLVFNFKGYDDDVVFAVFLLILLPLSLFVPPLLLWWKGIEFRKYGFYGAITSIVFLAIPLFRAITSG